MKVGVKLIFLMHDSQQAIVHLNSLKWDFSFGAVRLTGEGVEVDGRQVGFGDTGGDATVIFEPDEPWAQVVGKLQQIKDCFGQATLELIETKQD